MQPRFGPKQSLQPPLPAWRPRSTADLGDCGPGRHPAAPPWAPCHLMLHLGSSLHRTERSLPPTRGYPQGRAHTEASPLLVFACFRDHSEYTNFTPPASFRCEGHILPPRPLQTQHLTPDSCCVASCSRLVAGVVLTVCLSAGPSIHGHMFPLPVTGTLTPPCLLLLWGCS